MDDAETRAPRPRWRRAVAILAVLGLVTGGVSLNIGGIREVYDRIPHALGFTDNDLDQDTDHDGLTDAAEKSGWRTDFGTYVTNPHRSDTDRDGISDGLEAGPVKSASKADPVFSGNSDPTKKDTDGDGIGDGDEYFLDINPRGRDSDKDGLRDGDELKFGSDPTRANTDGDGYDDKEEHDRSSDPTAYDLGRLQAAAAFITGATAGDWEWGARHLAHMRTEQLQSREYLAGQIASGAVGIGDIRDIAANIGKLDLIGAVTSLAGLAPVIGDVTKTVKMLAKFAKQGDRAQRAVSDLIEKLPWSKETRKKVLTKVFGSAVRLPSSLKGGPKTYTVYRAMTKHGTEYVGITRDFERRKLEHAAAGRGITPVKIAGTGRYTRGEARAVEEACIFQAGFASEGGTLKNQIHSINPSRSDYEGAVAWGTARLETLNSSCA